MALLTCPCCLIAEYNLLEEEVPWNFLLKCSSRCLGCLLWLAPPSPSLLPTAPQLPARFPAYPLQHAAGRGGAHCWAQPESAWKPGWIPADPEVSAPPLLRPVHQAFAGFASSPADSPWLCQPSVHVFLACSRHGSSCSHFEHERWVLALGQCLNVSQQPVWPLQRGGQSAKPGAPTRASREGLLWWEGAEQWWEPEEMPQRPGRGWHGGGWMWGWCSSELCPL